jgi:hypothetical protein
VATRPHRPLEFLPNLRQHHEKSPKEDSGWTWKGILKLRRFGHTIDGAQQVEVRDVEVVATTYFTLRCIIGGRFVGVPSLKTLPGTDVARRGDRGRIVLPRDLAERLGLA